LKEYLSFVLEKGLIEEHQAEKRNYYYRITNNGRRFLEIYQQLGEMIGSTTTGTTE
jgi:predicted transcriptional regulator